MTSEERFTRIENALSAVAEHQPRHAEDIQQLREMQKGMVVAITRVVETQQRSMEAQQLTDAKLRELTDTQQITEQKLHALIDTVDRIIRHKN
jgi:hypothetical protein